MQPTDTIGPDVSLYLSDCRAVLAGMAAGAVDLIATDPPYFAVSELRAEPANLIVLCRRCHLFVHSRKNTRCEYIIRIDRDAFTRAR